MEGRGEEGVARDVECGVWSVFFFQAEDGIRDYDVTGVQTCALPILVLVSAGIVSLMLASGGGGRRGDWRRLAYPLATGAMIAAYTVADGLGVRLSGNPASYIGWLFLLSALPILSLAIHRRRGAALDFMRAHWKPAMAGGVLAFGAYSLVIWALSLAPMSHVSALRETSVGIAAPIGARLLRSSEGRRGG